MSDKAREGDIIETADNLFFDVKGLLHPVDKVVAFIRYVPNSRGDRQGEGGHYRKVYALSERYSLLKKAYPHYLFYDPVFDENLCEVPVHAISRHYKPTHRLQQFRKEDVLDETEELALELIQHLKDNAEVSWTDLGISGSILIGLHNPTSDIDPVVYGSDNCYRVNSALKILQKENGSPMTSYDRKGLRELFAFRSKDTVVSFKDFVRTESRKAFQGKFRGRDYFFRFVKNWNEKKEKYGELMYTSEGQAKIKARIVDDSESIFTPCRYRIENVEILEGERTDEEIREIASFRGRFCEQAREGEIVIAQGKVEKVQKEDQLEYYRLLLGNRTSDHMVLA